MKSVPISNPIRKSLSCGTMAFAVALFVTAVSTQATVISYTINNNPGGAPHGVVTNLSSFPGFGDNVSSAVVTNGSFIYAYGMGYGFTPDLTVDFTASAAITSAGFGQRYYSEPNWPQVDFLVSGATPVADRQFYTTFTPTAADKGVRINSFDLFGYLSSSNHTASWTIYEDVIGGTVLDSGAVVVAGNYQQNRSVVYTDAIEYMGTLVLEIHHTAGSGGAFAMDNLNFDQIPEPVGMAYLGMGILAYLGLRRNRRTLVSITVGVLAFSVATLRADTIYWAPAGGGTWDTSTANWTGDDTLYSDGGVDTVNFTNTTGGVITLNANHYPAAVNVSATAGTYQFTGASITGAIAITKSGAGTLELRSDVLSTGGLFINGGVVDVSQLKQTGGSIYGGTVNPIHFTGNSTLRISGTGGNYTYSPMIVDNGVTATLDQTASAASQYAGQISGGGNITVTGGGNPIFFFNGNTFTGNLTIQGSFKAIGDASLGNVNNTTILDGGLFYLSHSAPVSYVATRTLQINNSSSQLLPGAGGVWNGNVTGTGFTLQGAQGYGAASLYLANANNSFVGQVYVLTGTLELNTQGSLNGNNLLIGNSGGNGLRISGTPTGNFTGNLQFAQGGGTYHFVDVVNAGATMNLTGALNTDTTADQTLRKYGQGTLAINNAAGTYAGRLEVREGRLNVNYATPNLVGVVISNGASFGGSGTVNITGGAAITGDGSIDPGNSPGILTTAAVDPINGLGTLDFNFEFTKLDSPDYTNASASSNDVLRLTGASPFSGDTMTAANIISIYLPGNLIGGTNNFRGGFYTDVGDFLGSFSGATYRYYAQKSGGPFTYNGQQYDWMTNVYPGGVMLVTTVNETGTQFGGTDGFVMEFIGLGIPEPSSVLLIGLGGLVLTLRQRKETE